MVRKFKLIVGPTRDRLELLVNEFIGDPANDNWCFWGAPVKFQHDEYTQAFIYEEYN